MEKSFFRYVKNGENMFPTYIFNLRIPGQPQKSKDTAMLSEEET